MDETTWTAIGELGRRAATWGIIVSARGAMFLVVGGILLYDAGLVFPRYEASGAGDLQAPSAALSLLWSLAFHTVVVAFAATIVSFVIAHVFAVLLFRTRLPWRGVMAALLLVPAGVPLFALTGAALSITGIRSWEGSMLMAGALHGWAAAPLLALLMGTTYASLDRGFEQAALLEASWRRVLFWFDRPLMVAMLAGVFAFQVWTVMHQIEVTDILSVRTIAEATYVSYQVSPLGVRPAGILLVYAALFLPAAGAVMLGLRHHQRVRTPAGDTGGRPLPLGRRGGIWALGVAVFFAGLYVGPVVQLTSVIRSMREFVGHASSMVGEIGVTVAVSLGAAVLIGWLVAGLAGLSVSRYRSGRWAQVVILVVLAMSPAPDLAIGLIKLLNVPGWRGAVYDSYLPMIAGQTLRVLPLALLFVLPGWTGVGRELVDAARIEGCGAMALNRALYWPVTRSWWGTATVAGAILATGGLTTAVLLSPPGSPPLSVRYFTLIHYGLQSQAATICIVSVLILVPPWLMLLRWFQRMNEVGR